MPLNRRTFGKHSAEVSSDICFWCHFVINMQHSESRDNRFLINARTQTLKTFLYPFISLAALRQCSQMNAICYMCVGQDSLWDCSLVQCQIIEMMSGAKVAKNVPQMYWQQSPVLRANILQMLKSCREGGQYNCVNSVHFSMWFTSLFDFHPFNNHKDGL